MSIKIAENKDSLEVTGNFVQIRGILRNNRGSASDALRQQMPLIPADIRAGLDEWVGEIYLETINAELDLPLVIPEDQYDFDTGPDKKDRIKWSQKWVAERFLFKKCWLVTPDGQDHPCLIYKASSSPNNTNPFRVELISYEIPGLRPGDTVTIGLHDAKVIPAVSF